MESKREKKRRGGGLYFRGKKAKKGRKEIMGERWRCCSGETQVKGEMMRDISGSTIANDSILFRRRVARKPLLVNLRKLSFSHSRINARYLPRNTSAMPIGRSLSSSEDRGAFRNERLQHCSFASNCLPVRRPSMALLPERHGQI